MDEKPDNPSSIRIRTRAVIVEAALRVLVGDRSASMTEIAKKAEVARSTLHRYFPERTDLLNAVSEFAQEQVDGIACVARSLEGAPVDILLRLALDHFECWDAVMWNYAETHGDYGVSEPDEVDVEVLAVIERGYADGTVDRTLPGTWLQHALYATVYSAWEYERTGHSHSEAAMMLIATVRKILLPTPS